MNTLLSSRKTKLLSALLCSALLFSCDDDGPKQVDSDAVATGRIFATFQIISDGGDYVFAEAQLTLDVPPIQSDELDTYVRLVDNDELWLSAGTNLLDRTYSENIFADLSDLPNTQARFRNASSYPEIYDFLFFRTVINSFGTWYSASLPQSEDNTFQVALFRNNNDQAKTSTVALPGSFSIVAPDTLDVYSRSQDDIILEWNNTEPGLSLEVAATTTCPNNTFAEYLATQTDDQGIFTISAGELDSDVISGRCTTTINVRKAKLGEFDNRFVGGAVSGWQIRRIALTTDD